MQEPGTHSSNTWWPLKISALLQVHTLCMVPAHSLLDMAEIAFHRWISVILLDCNTVKAGARVFNLLLFSGLVELVKPQ